MSIYIGVIPVWWRDTIMGSMIRRGVGFSYVCILLMLYSCGNLTFPHQTYTLSRLVLFLVPHQTCTLHRLVLFWFLIRVLVMISDEKDMGVRPNTFVVRPRVYTG
jgi:hypothetical protein